MDDSAPSASSHALRGLKDIAFGSAAGIVSKVFEHPFDLAKVRLQAQVLDHEARFKGPLDCLRQTYVKEGVRGLYRGLPAPIVGAMAENASLFFAYNEAQTAIRRVTGITEGPLSLPQLAFAGAAAGSITSFFLTPIELVKCKMQVQMLVAESSAAAAAERVVPRSFATMPGPLSVLASTFRSTGFRGLWLGQTGTFIRETGGGAAWFATNEFVKRLFIARRAGAESTKDLNALELGLAGAASGVAYNLALFPADSVKSTMQTEDELRPGTAGQKRTFFSTFRAMYRAGGVRALYAGCGITVARAVPSSAMIFLIYDGLTRRFS
ncbi:putative mitochondrial amino acid transporter ARG-13 [Exidia glandulosa HHB12029]|uniref:Putative mitochondrial amino acid transporter ARG-13 n=1 Tax=Exidia glandulosa HHB12029 TaxID=1314781 RepID=A0A165DCI5_EXIGL|nr:putative mitochondrial amino acid transporter ARG-13 [Exidia glandulosa HHB12029]